MNTLFLCIIVFLFLLAIFDLSVGVSNDAVNFLNSALGTKAAKFRTIITVASIGVFIGAAMSNGMMDVARHGIFRPENFNFYELMCIFMAVMVTDIILLDIFNSLGMPTSTTVSMVFELLGATFAIAVVKMAGDASLTFPELLNTGKALSVIIGIFLSVAIAFVFGTIVQFLTRYFFSFNYKKNLTWKIGIFGGICATAIIYFLLIKGAKDLTFMTPEVKGWIKENTLLILGGCFVCFSLLMQLLHLLKVNVLKVVVLMGTFSLAMAFAGNDLVNFIGVPLTGLASFLDFTTNGTGDAHSFMMGSLNGPSNTPIVFLIGAGLIMVISLATSRKARNVSKTEIGLGSQQGGEEMFGSSRLARRLVKWAISISSFISHITPERIKRQYEKRFNVDDSIMERGAAFDLVRGSINLVLAGALIALGTSLKLPLSTTFVTFMVAMGTSLSDKAWGRESAVFRITGVISVIGGWFITAGAAFIGASIVVLAMYYGGHIAMIVLAIITIGLIIRSNIRFKKNKQEEEGDMLFQTILATNDEEECWQLTHLYITRRQQETLARMRDYYASITDGFIHENLGTLSKTAKKMMLEKRVIKSNRRKETLGMRRVSRDTALEKNTWFHLSNNYCMSILYNLRRIAEMCKEHIENNFLPLPAAHVEEYNNLRTAVLALYDDVLAMMEQNNDNAIPELRKRGEEMKNRISATYHHLFGNIHSSDTSEMSVLYVYLGMLQETREMVSALRKYLRSYAKLNDTEFDGRSSDEKRVAPIPANGFYSDDELDEIDDTTMSDIDKTMTDIDKRNNNQNYIETRTVDHPV